MRFVVTSQYIQKWIIYLVIVLNVLKLEDTIKRDEQGRLI